MSDTTPTEPATIDDVHAEPLPKRPDMVGRLLAYRIAFEDGTLEVHEGHAVSQPTTGFIRIHRRFDTGWQLVFAARAELVRTVRAMAGLEYDQLLRVHATLNQSLDHLGSLIAGLGECNQGYGSGEWCDADGHISSDGGGPCDVPAARKFLNELRPF